MVTSKSCICSTGGEDHNLVSSIRTVSVEREEIQTTIKSNMHSQTPSLHEYQSITLSHHLHLIPILPLNTKTVYHITNTQTPTPNTPSHHGDKSLGMPSYLLAFIWNACAPGSNLRKFAIDQCVIDVRVGHFGAGSKEAMIKFAEKNEDFARVYVAASITNGHRERRDLLKDLGGYSSIAKSNKKYLPGFGSYCFFGA